MCNSHNLTQVFGLGHDPRFKLCRLFSSLNDVYCIFLGSLNNLCTLNKQYGLSKVSNEAMFVIEAYCTLRDRGPIPAHQVLKDLEGDFGFVIYDHRAGVVFAANVSEIHHQTPLVCDRKMVF